MTFDLWLATARKHFRYNEFLARRARELIAAVKAPEQLEACHAAMTRLNIRQPRHAQRMLRHQKKLLSAMPLNSRAN